MHQEFKVLELIKLDVPSCSDIDFILLNLTIILVCMRSR